MKEDQSNLSAEWAAYYALQGDEPLECVFEALTQLREQIGLLSAGRLEEGEASKIISNTHFFLIAIEELFNPRGISIFRAEITKRKRGPIPSRHSIAKRHHKAVSLVRKLQREGWESVEAAVQQASDETGVSRAEIFAWMKGRKFWEENSPEYISRLHLRQAIESKRARAKQMLAEADADERRLFPENSKTG